MLVRSWIEWLLPRSGSRKISRVRQLAQISVMPIEALESRMLLTDLQLVADALATNEDTPIVANLITGTNGASADSVAGPVTLTSVTQPAHGSVTFLADGTVTYTPVADFNGVDTFTYTVDTGTSTETAAVTVSVASGFDINSDIFITNTNVPITDNVITRDGSHDDFEGTPAVVSVTQGQSGVVSFQADGTVTYVPNLNFVGQDKFTYTVESGGVTETANVFVFVNEPEFLVPDSLITGVNSPITANVITGTNGASRDPIAEPTGLSRVTQGQHGTVTFLFDGTITYTPDPGFVGEDVFTYSVPVEFRTESTTVNVIVGMGFRLFPDALTINEDSPITSNVLTGTNGATADFFSTPATLVEVTQPAHGSVTFQPDGTVTYTPAADFYGVNTATPTDSFSYTVAVDGETATTTVTITIVPVDDAVDDEVACVEEFSSLFNVLTGTNQASADHFEGSPTLVGVTQPAHGTVTFLANGDITYTTIPGSGFVGEDFFTYTVESGGVTETAIVSVAVIEPYLINSDDLMMNEDAQITANLMTGTNGATADIVEASATLLSVQQPDHGSVVFQSNGTITYTPNPDFFGTEFFYYTVNLGRAGTSTSSVTIKVLPIGDVVSDTLATQEGVPVTANLITGSGGASADNFEGAATISSITQGLYGAVTFLPNGTVTYSPVPGFSGQDRVRYEIFSGSRIEEGFVTINVASNGAVTDDSLITDEDTPITANLVTGTNGATSDNFLVPFTLTNIFQPNYGTVTFQPDGTVTYVPLADFHGEIQFHYQVTTATGTQLGTVTVQIRPVVDTVNDNVTVAQDVPSTFNVLTGTNGASADNFEQTAVLVSVTQGAEGTVATSQGDGTLTYTPRAGFIGVDTFTYTVLTVGHFETGTVTVTVAPASPQIRLHSPTGTYNLGRKKAFVDPTLSFLPAFGLSHDFSHAILTATVTEGHTSKTVLSIYPEGDGSREINVTGKKIRYGSTVIGTFRGGKGREPVLTIELNSQATVAAVERLLQRVNYRNDLYVPAVTIQLQITNISGHDTNTAIRHFNVVQPASRKSGKNE